MAITTAPIGTLGGAGAEGYFFTSVSPATYKLPPSSKGWSFMFARLSGSTNISYVITYADTGGVLREKDANANVLSEELHSNYTGDGVNITIRNSTTLQVCIAHGFRNVPPTA